MIRSTISAAALAGILAIAWALPVQAQTEDENELEGPRQESYAAGPNATLSDEEFFDRGEMSAGNNDSPAGDYEGYGWGWEGKGYDVNATRSDSRRRGYYDTEFDDQTWNGWFED